MASAFGHALTALAIRSGFSKTLGDWKFAFIGVACSILPDADVLAFQFGIAYEDFWGHRGFTHSIVFAFLLGFLVTLLFYSQHLKTRNGIYYVLFFSLCTVSHGILDAMTTGGLGVAFFSPFDNNRYFFPWRPIKVSPIGAGQFFGEKGIRVLKSEAVWIGIPCTIFMIIMKFVRRKQKPK